MFKKITDAVTEKIEELEDNIKDALQRSRKGIDTEQFNDPIANQTDWDPLIPGGTNIRTHKLHKDMRGNIKFKAGIGALIFSGFFFLIGLAALGIAGSVIVESGLNSEAPFISLFGVGFGGIGLWMLRRFTTPIVFSFQKGYFYKGWLRDNERPQQKGLTWCPIEEIHALQIVSERIDNDSSYYSHELNIIKKDASRLNIVDYADISKLRSDAIELAKTLDVPLWDASKEAFRLFG